MCIGSFQEGQLVDAPLWHGAVGTPLHAFVERLMLVGAEECPWKAFLPVLLRERGACEEVLARARADTARRLGQLGDVSLSGRIWKMSRDACGCRLVQSALDKAATDQEKEALTYELHGHVWEAIHCPHANHVLQKVVVLLRPEALQFVVQELLAGGAINASRHKYGCRVVQRLIEYCPPHQTCGIVDALLQELTSVAGHPYGNYVIQKAVQHGLQVHQQFIVSAIKADIGSFATDPNLSAVLGAAIEHCDAHSAELAAMLVEDGRLLVAMACSRLGHASISHVLDALSPSHYAQAKRLLRNERKTLRASRFGKQVLQVLAEDTEGPSQSSQ